MPIRRRGRLREPLPALEPVPRPPQFRAVPLWPQLAEVRGQLVAAEPNPRRSNLRRVGSGGEVPRSVLRCEHLRAPYEFALIARQAPRCGGRRPRQGQNPAVSRASGHAEALAAGSPPANLSLSASID